MTTARNPRTPTLVYLDPSVHPFLLTCLVATVSYFVSGLGGTLELKPQMVWPLWPGCALLLAALLVVRRKVWPILFIATLAGFALYDVQAGVPIRSIVVFIAADALEVLIAALGVSYIFQGPPQLNDLKSLAKYSLFAVILAPFTSAFLFGALAIRGEFWITWKLSFFSGALAYLTLTPAILSWVTRAPGDVRKSRSSTLEAMALLIALCVFGYFTFAVSAKSFRPAMLYSVVPFLLWSALRFGSMGVSTSVIVVAFLSIWGAVHGRGPFIGPDPVQDVLSMQLFLLIASVPFMVLAAVVEERRSGEEELRQREGELKEAQRLAQLGSWRWEPATDTAIWSEELYRIAARDSSLPAVNYKGHSALYTPESWDRLRQAVEEALRSGTSYELDLEMVRPDQTTRWLIARGEADLDAAGRVVQLRGTVQDITARKRAEEELRESEEKFRSVFRDAGVGMAIVSPDGRFLAGNGAFCDFIGYTEVELLGRTVQSVTHPEDWPAFSRRLTQALADGTGFQRVEKRCLHKNGPVLCGECSASLILDANGKPQYFVAEVLDVTERKQAEKTLRASEERFRLAAQAGRMFAYEWDAATDVIVRSAESAQILGIDDAKPFTGQEAFSKVHPDDREELLAAISNLSPKQPNLEITYRMLRADGTVTWVARNSRARFDEQGKLERVIGMITDITERKRTEEALRESEERLRLAAQAAKMYAYEWDVATDAVIRSAGSRNVFGLTGEPLRLMRHELLARVHPDDKALFTAAFDKLTTKNPTTHITYRVLRPDGALVWLEKTARGFFDGQGKLLRMIGMVVDITERKRAEEALSSVGRRLIEAQEQERTRIARELHDDLSQRMALLQMGLEQFEQDTATLSDEARQKLHQIAELVSEGSSIIHNISHQLHPSKLDTLGLVSAIGGYCRELSKQHDLQIDFVHRAVPGQLSKDVSLCLFRIVQEALRNVVKHSGAAEAKVELYGLADRLDLHITDPGRGFSGESEDGRTGLGLISMQERLRLVGGHLSIDSEPTRGTRIRAHVPVPRADAQATIEEKVHKAGA